ncbi:hypothetical protein B1209_26690 [Raoultella planticola]|uniref:Uncharacterized protein n=1 Tax=Raoultella planticola TaxID=575 RepID=A0A443VJ56_RAOPL|nr:hypothetical protein CRT62_26370 [Raoultella planticola]ATM18361.1 hypothetical protein CRN15_08480 [Raoultella planticola]AUU07173.1 hypothetical protein MC50_008655 [Raoultella planticola]AUV56045.1 hypothetical protein B1209_26690 [Raoultella planticola]OZP71006.1 hypothetical protein CIG23_25960 [Raoultella planticola]
MVPNVHTIALYWCNAFIMVQPFCTMECMITPFGGNLKVGTDFALYFLRQQRHIKQLKSFRYHDDNDQSGRV